MSIRYTRVPSCDWLDCRSERPGGGHLNAASRGTSRSAAAPRGSSPTCAGSVSDR